MSTKLLVKVNDHFEVTNVSCCRGRRRWRWRTDGGDELPPRAILIRVSIEVFAAAWATEDWIRNAVAANGSRSNHGADHKQLRKPKPPLRQSERRRNLQYVLSFREICKFCSSFARISEVRIIRSSSGNRCLQ